MPIVSGISTIEAEDNMMIDHRTASNGYDPSSAVSYAASWWNKTNNSSYPYYTAYNGLDVTDNYMNSINGRRTYNDCTNFVSQCLFAGGMDHFTGYSVWHTAAWFYNNTKPSNTWGGAPNFYYHWKWRAGVAASTAYLTVGDVVSADMYGDDEVDHTAIITADNGSSSSDLLLTQHTGDKHQVSSLGDWFNWGYTVYGYEMDKANN